MYVDDGINIDASWTEHIAVSTNNVDWELINKKGLSITPRFINKPQGGALSNDTASTRISLMSESGQTKVDFECDKIINQTTWNGRTKAALQVAVSDIAGWL
tara:strand:- start:95 stop:400 length:306 start_codon:yes stop_codon:yes gene_type:complete